MPLRLLPILFLIVLPPAAFAQAPQQQLTPDQQASQTMILELTGQKLSLQAQVIAAQRQIDDLNRQLTEAKKLASTDKP